MDVQKARIELLMTDLTAMHVERAFVICLHFFLAVYVQLQCPAREWIHVLHEAYGDGDAGTCRLKSAGSCSLLLASSQQGLVVNCNGKQSCREAMQAQTINNCNITDAAAEVKYNCIKGSLNMCSPVTTTVNGSVYLHSPGFPDSVGVNSSCVVRITGQTLQVILLEERIQSGMLKISGDGRQLWTNVKVGQYNRLLSGPVAQIAIVYDNHDQDRSYLWIKVVDTGQMMITISGETSNASTTPTSTQQPSQSASGPSTSDTPTTETTARAQSTTIVAASFTTVTSTSVQTTRSTQWTSKSTMTSTTISTTVTSNSGDVVTALSVVCGILVLIIVVLVIYFMVVKPYRKKHDTSSNAGTSGHGEPNVYDGMQRNTSDAGDEHNYGHITSSEGPFYANSVNGDGPYVNT